MYTLSSPNTPTVLPRLSPCTVMRVRYRVGSASRIRSILPSRAGTATIAINELSRVALLGTLVKRARVYRLSCSSKDSQLVKSEHCMQCQKRTASKQLEHAELENCLAPMNTNTVAATAAIFRTKEALQLMQGHVGG